jgi:peptidyl-Lys metalloendopeptidase
MLSALLTLASLASLRLLPAALAPAHVSTTCSRGDAWCLVLEVGAGPRGAEVEAEGTPLGGEIGARGLRVTGWPGGEPVPFAGRLFKRLPDPASRLRLAPGETRWVGLDLSEAFALGEGRQYSVALGAWTGPAREKADPLVLPPLARAPPQPGRHAAAQAQAVCAGANATLLETAMTNAQAGLEVALGEYLQRDRCAGGHDYTTWFGRPSEARYAEVVATLEAAYALIADRGIIFICDPVACRNLTSVFAYVYPNDHKVYLCEQFWRASASLAYNSQPGTLIHEATHFDDVGATDDHRYGDVACRGLALAEPDLAVNNADNYEFFVEFVPSADDGCDPCAPAATNGTCLARAQCGWCPAGGDGAFCAGGGEAGPYARAEAPCPSGWAANDAEASPAGRALPGSIALLALAALAALLAGLA